MGEDEEDAPLVPLKKPKPPQTRQPPRKRENIGPSTTEGHPILFLHPYYAETVKEEEVNPKAKAKKKAVRKNYPCEMPGCKFVGHTYRELAIQKITPNVHHALGALPSWQR